MYLSEKAAWSEKQLSDKLSKPPDKSPKTLDKIKKPRDKVKKAPYDNQRAPYKTKELYIDMLILINLIQ